MKSLGEDVCQLLRGVDSDQAKVTILNRLVGKVLPDVNVLCTLTAADDVVAPFDARVVVFVDRRPFLWCKPHILQEVSEINHLNSRCGC